MGRKQKNKFAASHQGGLGTKPAVQATTYTPVARPAAAISQPRDSLSLIRLSAAMAAIADHKSNAFLKAAEAAPFTIRANGLGTGLAMLAAKGGQDTVFAALIAQWLLEGCEHSPLPKAQPTPTDDEGWNCKFLSTITTSDRNTYRAAQTEALGYATVLKRLAQAFCPADGAGGDGDDGA